MSFYALEKHALAYKAFYCNVVSIFLQCEEATIGSF